MTQHVHILAHHGQKNLGYQILTVFRTQPQRAALGRVVDHVHNQPHEAVDEIFPGSGLPGQAALQQIAVDLGQCHVRVSPWKPLVLVLGAASAASQPQRGGRPALSESVNTTDFK